MSKDYLKQQSQPTQREPRDARQIKNEAGGFVYATDRWERLQRFLVLGTEGGSYYASERDMTRAAVRHVRACIAEDGARAVRMIREVSVAGRAPKQDPALYALALAASAEAEATRVAALGVLPEVCRTASTLFSFLSYCEGLRGWGRGLRRAVSAWYNAMEPERLAYQMAKYRNRAGYTHADALRLAHPQPVSPLHETLYRWATGHSLALDDHEPGSPQGLVYALEVARGTTDSREIVRLIQDYRLTREMIPPHFLREREVWEALLGDMPMTAMLRNLVTMARVGLLKPFSDTEGRIVDQLGDYDRLLKARVHPLNILQALQMYRAYSSDRARSVAVIDALNEAYHASFDAIEPTGKRTMLALDISSSMTWGEVAGIKNMTPREASSAMAMVTARTEPHHLFVGFSHDLIPLTITSTMRLDSVLDRLRRLPFGGTNCSRPMGYALENRIPVDTFVVYTDNQTWSGQVHPATMLQRYRDQMGIDAKLIVVAMMANAFSIADPADGGMLDVIGFDTNTPQAMSAFARGI